MKKTYSTLVISPHCDDEALGCAGMLYNRKKDSNTFVYYMGVDLFHIVKREDRVKEVDDVSKYLNFDYRIGTNQVNHYHRDLIIDEITDLINEIKPKEVFIPNPSYNQDHKEVYDACMIALRPHDRNYFVPCVFVFEVDQYLLWGDNNFEPNYFEPIDVDSKIKAYEMYKSQVRLFRPPELIKNYARIRGLSSNTQYAEAFKIIRMTKDENYSNDDDTQTDQGHITFL